MTSSALLTPENLGNLVAAEALAARAVRETRNLERDAGR